MWTKQNDLLKLPVEWREPVAAKLSCFCSDKKKYIYFKLRVGNNSQKRWVYTLEKCLCFKFGNIKAVQAVFVLNQNTKSVPMELKFPTKQPLGSLLFITWTVGCRVGRSPGSVQHHPSPCCCCTLQAIPAVQDTAPACPSALQKPRMHSPPAPVCPNSFLKTW